MTETDWRKMARQELEAKGYMNVTECYLEQKAAQHRRTQVSDLLKQLEGLARHNARKEIGLTASKTLAGQAAARIRELEALLDECERHLEWVIAEKNGSIGTRELYAKLRTRENTDE